MDGLDGMCCWVDGWMGWMGWRAGWGGESAIVIVTINAIDVLMNFFGVLIVCSYFSSNCMSVRSLT